MKAVVVSFVSAGAVLALAACTSTPATSESSSAAPAPSSSSAMPMPSETAVIPAELPAYCDPLQAAVNAGGALSMNPGDEFEAAEYSKFVGQAAEKASGELSQWLADLSAVTSPTEQPNERTVAYVFVEAGKFLKQIELNCGIAL